jgi:hypothetical protein
VAFILPGTNRLYALYSKAEFELRLLSQEAVIDPFPDAATLDVCILRMESLSRPGPELKLCVCVCVRACIYTHIYVARLEIFGTQRGNLQPFTETSKRLNDCGILYVFKVREKVIQYPP